MVLLAKLVRKELLDIRALLVLRVPLDLLVKLVPMVSLVLLVVLDLLDLLEKLDPWV
jgi:hypothetical protein